MGIRTLNTNKRERSPSQPWWIDLPTEKLLDVRICDLELSLEDTALGGRVQQLLTEFEQRGLCFRPYVWLSVDWFTPDGSTGFAVPFYLAHRRLARLERAHMHEVEGGVHSWCMQLMRHEAGHAIDHAYRLRRRRRWRETFGSSSAPYEDSYSPNPRSRAFVQHLDRWYSQSHPLEDFAETFSVWLRPGWRKRYAGWPALTKLHYVDELMGGLADSLPPVRTRSRPDHVASLRITLREYFRRRQELYGAALPKPHDRLLRQLFPLRDQRGRESAARFLTRRRVDLARRVAEGTSQPRYLVEQLVQEMIASARRLELRLARAEDDAFVDACIFLTSATLRFLHGTRPRFDR